VKKPKREVLDVEFDFNFKLFALSTTLRDYQLCYQINKNFLYNLRRVNDIEVNQPKKQVASVHSHFSFCIEELQREIHLITNHSNGSYFLSELKIADYLLKLMGEVSEEEETEILNRLRKIQSVNLVKEIPVDSIRQKNNLIFD